MSEVEKLAPVSKAQCAHVAPQSETETAACEPETLRIKAEAVLLQFIRRARPLPKFTIAPRNVATPAPAEPVRQAAPVQRDPSVQRVIVEARKATRVGPRLGIAWHRHFTSYPTKPPHPFLYSLAAQPFPAGAMNPAAGLPPSLIREAPALAVASGTKRKMQDGRMAVVFAAVDGPQELMLSGATVTFRGVALYGDVSGFVTGPEAHEQLQKLVHPPEGEPDSSKRLTPLVADRLEVEVGWSIALGAPIGSDLQALVNYTKPLVEQQKLTQLQADNIVAAKARLPGMTVPTFADNEAFYWSMVPNYTSAHAAFLQMLSYAPPGLSMKGPAQGETFEAWRTKLLAYAKQFSTCVDHGINEKKAIDDPNEQAALRTHARGHVYSALIRTPVERARQSSTSDPEVNLREICLDLEARSTTLAGWVASGDVRPEDQAEVLEWTRSQSYHELVNWLRTFHNAAPEANQGDALAVIDELEHATPPLLSADSATALRQRFQADIDALNDLLQPLRKRGWSDF